MCLVSDKIKFCTCAGSSYERLKHYWLLYRFNKEKNSMIIGEPIMPHGFQFLYEPNKATFLKRLNEDDAFDVPIKFVNEDQIELVINNLADDYNERMTFCFRYFDGKWIPQDYDYFTLESHYDEFKFGKLNR